jgi:hypothetical protein
MNLGFRNLLEEAVVERLDTDTRPNSVHLRC